MDVAWIVMWRKSLSAIWRKRVEHLRSTLSAQGKRPAAVEAYKHFLTRWAKADSHAKFLVEGKNELTALENPAPKPQ
jgi:hypothetical protein